jgi:hypothetical protein
MSFVSRPTFRWAEVICSRVTPHRFIQYSTALRADLVCTHQAAFFENADGPAPVRFWRR